MINSSTVKSTKEFCSYKSSVDYNIVDKAMKFAKKAHEGQFRKSGDPFFEHPLCVAKKVCEKYSDAAMTSAAFLHDTVEDCDEITIEDIYSKFGESVGFLIDALNKKECSFYKFPEKKFKSKTERLIWAGMQDVRVLILKLADREHNLETLEHLKDNKQVRIAFEAQAIYEPLKKILGYDRPFSIQESAKKLENVMKKYNLNNEHELKLYLYKKYFNNFSADSFDVVYRNPDSVIWRVEGVDMYKQLCSKRIFKGKIDIISVRSNGEWLTADFKFKKGVVSDSNKLKLNLQSFKSK